jgi:predicted AAA+ superfamily ATPase
MIPRILNLPFKRNSVFLFGPRQVGKSTLIKHLLAQENYIEIDLLKNEVFLKYKTNPELLRSEIEFLARKKDRIYVFIDEVQKCPLEEHGSFFYFHLRMLSLVTGLISKTYC